MGSGILLWASYPPFSLWPIAWVATIGWIVLIRQVRLVGPRPYLAIWFASIVHNLLLFQWIRLPHWSANFGWLALCLYLSVYLLAFVAVSRLAVHRLRVPIVLAVPMVWTGLELARGYLLTGFSMGLLGHTQVGWTSLIQLSDLFGAYGVSFLLVLVSACTVRMLPLDSRSWCIWPAFLLVVAVMAAWLYGIQAIARAPEPQEPEKPLRVALIQGSIDVAFDKDQSLETARQYMNLSLRAIDEHPDVELIVWPESMFSNIARYVNYEAGDVLSDVQQLQADQANKNFHERLRSFVESHRNQRLPPVPEREPIAQPRLPSFIVGLESWNWSDVRFDRFNSALLIDPSGVVAGCYNKMHRVMFGEYVPFGEYFPVLYGLTPMPSGLTAGREPEIFEVSELRLSPSICFESTVPHLIRRHVNKMAQRGEEPDVLVNVTNDGWFWGSSELDMHLACGVFRAIEMRKPILIAANTGLSAHIDANGTVLKQGPRRREAVLVTDLVADGRSSYYCWWGDLLAGGCLLFCLGTVGIRAVQCWGRKIRHLRR